MGLLDEQAEKVVAGHDRQDTGPKAEIVKQDHQLDMLAGWRGQLAEEQIRQESKHAALRQGRVGRPKEPVTAGAAQHLGDVTVAVLHAEDKPGEVPRIALRKVAQEIRNRGQEHDHDSKTPNPGGSLAALIRPLLDTQKRIQPHPSTRL